MEHRCLPRIAISLPVTVIFPSGRSMAGTIRNLSLEGGFVTLPSRPPKPRGIVHLEVTLPFSKPVRCRWRAIVTRASLAGVGLLFEERAMGYLLPYFAAMRKVNRAFQAPQRRIADAQIPGS